MKNISPLQIGVFAACIVGVVLAVLIFSDKIKIGGNAAEKISGTVTMWGTLPASAMRASFEVIAQTYKDVRVDYTQKNQATFQSELVEALASGVGPDLITVDPGNILVNQARLFPIPYASLPQSSFLATFVDESAQFMTPTGIVALPMTIDPLIMYYNRDMLSSSFTLNPPATWDEVVELNKVVTKRDEIGKLSTETVALGTFDNIKNAKDIISLFFLQFGNKIVSYDENQKQYISRLGDSTLQGGLVAMKAIDFYTKFADPLENDHYSWSTNLPMDRDQFIAGKLALYFGYASEITEIRRKNPNLNFQVALMPQLANSPTKVTYGAINGIAAIKMSKNLSLAMIVMQELVKKPAVEAYLAVDPTRIPVRRDMLINMPDDLMKSLFMKSVIISQTWLDPNPVQTAVLFRKYISDINAGLIDTQSAISAMDSSLNVLLEKIQPKQTEDSSDL